MLLSRVQGSLVAGVVGDCIGSMFEFVGDVKMQEVLDHVEKNIEKKQEANESKNKSRSQRGTKRDREGSEGTAKEETEDMEKNAEEESLLPQFHCFTDDTAMARSVAASLIEHQNVNTKDMAQRFSSEFKAEPHRGYGAGAVFVLRALGKARCVDVYEPARQQFDGSGSYGNGGGMRIAPLGLFFYKLPHQELREKALEVTRLTHAHREGEMGGVVVALAVQLALSLDNTAPLDTQAYLTTLRQRVKQAQDSVYASHRNSNVEADSEHNFCDKLEVVQEFLLKDEIDAEEVEEKLGTGVSAIDSIPTAVFCFLRGSCGSIPLVENRNPVERTILLAISLGGDTDTIATMAGSMSAAFYGLEMIPAPWQKACEGVEDALDFGEKMCDILKSQDNASC